MLKYSLAAKIMKFNKLNFMYPVKLDEKNRKVLFLLLPVEADLPFPL
jgi:hypothetical protein